MIAFYKLLASFFRVHVPCFFNKGNQRNLERKWWGAKIYCDVKYMLWGNNIYNYGVSS